MKDIASGFCIDIFQYFVILTLKKVNYQVYKHNI